MARSERNTPWDYTRAQRGGLMLLLLLLAGGYWLARTLDSREAVDYSLDDAELFTAARQLRTTEDADPATADRAEGFAFDPNTVSTAELRRLGLSDKQATAFLRYRSKVTFRSAADLGKLRVLRPEQAAHLMKFADFPSAPAEAVPVTYETEAAPPERFPFDPNTLSEDSLQLLGLDEREARALVRYRSYRPVTFHKPEDLLRVRALDSTKATALLSLVTIDLPESPAPAAPPPDEEIAEPASIDINRAAPEEWATLPGIGPYRAGRIVAFRERLGGFARVEQVGETYGIPDSVFQAIRSYLRPSPPPRPLLVNQMDAEELAAHPYLPRTTAVIIVRYRDNHGPFASAEDLKKVRAVSTETLDALLPYLNFDP